MGKNRFHCQFISIESWLDQEGALPVVLAGVAKLKVEPGTAAAVVLVPKPPKAPEQKTRRLEKTPKTNRVCR